MVNCPECGDDIPNNDMVNHQRFHARNQADKITIASQVKKQKIKRGPIDPDAKRKRFID